MLVHWGIVSNLVGRFFNAVSPLAGRLFGRWWRRYQIRTASSEKLAVLVCRVSGDNFANSNQLSIREAITEAIPGVSVHSWPEEWQLPDGEEQAAQTAAYQTARKWLRSKNCDLLIAARMKSATVISLRFIPSGEARSFEEPETGSQTYALLLSTMDLPTNFRNDLGAALATCVISNLNEYLRSGYVSALSRVTMQVQKIVETPSKIDDVRARARLTNCFAVGRAVQFEYGGHRDEIQAAIDGFKKACQLVDKREHPVEWSHYRCNFGAAVARLGSISNDIEALNVALEAMLDAPSALVREPMSWTKAQLNLASLYFTIFRMNGSRSRLQSCLEVCDQLISDDLLEKEPTLWAAVQDQFGRGLTALAELQATDDALTRGMEAFTHALEVWTDKYPLMQATTLINFSQALIALSVRQSNLNGFTEAISRLREAGRLISERDHPRLWLLLQNNLGLSLVFVADAAPRRYREAIAVLRAAREKTPANDAELFPRISLALAKALFFFGKSDHNVIALKEGISIVDDMKQIDNVALRDEAQNNLGVAYQFLGTISDDVDLLLKSRGILEELLEHSDPEKWPFVVFRSQQALGVTLREIGTRTRSIPTLRRAIEVLQVGFSFTSRETSPTTWAAVQTHLAAAYFEIAKLDREREMLRLSHTAISEALSVLGPNSTGALTAEARDLAELIQEYDEETSGEPTRN